MKHFRGHVFTDELVGLHRSRAAAPAAEKEASARAGSHATPAPKSAVQKVLP